MKKQLKNNLLKFKRKMDNKEFNFVISLLKNQKQFKSNKSFSTNDNLAFHIKTKNDDIKFPEITPMNKTTTQNLFRPSKNIIENNNNDLSTRTKKPNKNLKYDNNISTLYNILPYYQNKPTFSFKKFKEISHLKNSIKPPNIFNNIQIYKNNRNKSQKTGSYSSSKSPPKEKNMITYVIRYLNFRPYLDLPKTLNQEKNDLIGIKYYFKLLGNECLLVKNLLEDNGFYQSFSNSIDEWSIIWSSCHVKLNLFSQLNRFQKINHFPRSNELTRKDLLYKNVAKLKGNFPGTKFDFMPISYLLPNEISFLKDEMAKENQLFIIKPVASSQGRGIFLTDNISDIPSGYNMIASKYILNPFLINKKKFDLRIYVFVTSIVPLKIYRYDEGLTRFASDDYNDNINDRCSHLTNYAVNKNNRNYKINSDFENNDFNSNKWNLKGFKQYLDKHNIKSKDIFKKIDDIIIKTIIACESPLQKAMEKYSTYYNNNCFELFGFDILLDSFLTPWLMEVNLSPNLHYDAPIDLKIKGEMVAEIFDIMRVVPYDLRNEYYENNSKYHKINKMINSIKELKEFKIGKDYKEMIWHCFEENKRLIHFDMIFPTENYMSYRKFFDEERDINIILHFFVKEGFLRKNNM